MRISDSLGTWVCSGIHSCNLNSSLQHIQPMSTHDRAANQKTVLEIVCFRRLSETLGWHFLILRHIQKVPFQGLVEVPYSFKGSRGWSHPIGVVLPSGRCQQWHPWCSAKDVFSVFCLDNPAPCSSGWWRGCMFWAPNFETTVSLPKLYHNVPLKRVVWRAVRFDFWGVLSGIAHFSSWDECNSWNPEKFIQPQFLGSGSNQSSLHWCRCL